MMLSARDRGWEVQDFLPRITCATIIIAESDKIRGWPLSGVTVVASQMSPGLRSECYHLMFGNNVEYRCTTCDNKFHKIHADPHHAKHWKNTYDSNHLAN